MSTHKSTKKRGVVNATLPADPESLVRFAELLKLRTLACTTQAEYLRYVRKLAGRVKRDPALLTEAEVRAHLLHLTREQIRALLAAVREDRFRVFFRLVYACGLRVSEAVKLRVADIREQGRYLHLKRTKGSKERQVPLPRQAYLELRRFWKTHRHPRLIFPGVGRGWRDRPESQHKLAQAVNPMGVGSIQNCLRHARVEARLPEGTCVHTLRHSYATHLLEEGVNIR